MKEYQYQNEGKQRLPKEVYYQCIWMIRDMERLKEIINGSGEQILNDKDMQKLEDALIKFDCLLRALEEVPDYYREGIIESVRNRGGGYGDFAHENTWKKWKSKFMCAFATNLGLL